MPSVVAKKIGPIGSTGWVVLWGEGDSVAVGDTIRFTYLSTGERIEFEPTSIGKVMNMTGGDCTVDNLTFGPGEWDLWETPIPAVGLSITAISGAGNNNVLVRYYGHWRRSTE